MLLTAKNNCAVHVLHVLLEVLLPAMAMGRHLSEGEGHAAGCSRDGGALHLICLAVGYIMLPAVARRACHDQQRARWQEDGIALS